MEHLDTVEGAPQGTYYRHPVMGVSETGAPMIAHVYRTNPSGPLLMVDYSQAPGLPGDYAAELMAFDTVD